MDETQRNNTTRKPDDFLAQLIGTVIAVYTTAGDTGTVSGYGGAPHDGQFMGRLDTQNAEAIIIETLERGQPSGKRVLIYKRTIVAIEQR